MADYNDYLITIKCNSGELVFKSKKAEGNSTYYTKLQEEKDQKKWTITVRRINYVKEIYTPCHLTLNLELSMTDKTETLVSFGELISVFTNAEVTINAKRGTENEETIISNYYINSVEPSLQPNKSYKLKLDAYSADYQLKTDNFSECYLNTSLKSIIENHNKALSKEKYQTNPLKFSCDVKDGLQNINYKTVNEEYQVYHTPYAVQYNESFYDFIARLAHRYGEFLFFENGSLHLGVDPELTKITHNLDTTTSVNGELQTTTNYYKSVTQTAIPDSKLGTLINGSHYDYLNPDSLDQSQEFNYDLDYAEDMYMESLEMKDLKEDYVDWRMFMGWVGLARKCLTFLTSCRREDGFSAKEINDTWGAFAKLAIAWVDAGFTAKGKVDKTNANYKSFYEALKSGGYDVNEQESDGKMRPFATYLLNESLLGTQHRAAQKDYSDAEATRKSRESDLSQQKLGDAKKSFEKMIGKAQSLKEKLSAYKDMVTEKKDELTPLITKLDEIIKAAKETTVEVKKDNITYNKTCLELLRETDYSLNTNIEKRKTERKKEENFDAEVTNNKNKDTDTETYETAIKSIQDCIKLFEKSFLDKDGKNDYLSSACKLTNFCAVEDDKLISSDQKAAERKAFSNTIQNDYVSLKATLEDAKGKITSTQKNLDRMLKIAYFVLNAVEDEKKTYDRLLGLSLKITQGNLFHKFLESVEKAEISSAKRRMSLEIDTSNYTKIPLLGQTITFDNVTYLIIGVRSDYTLNTSDSAFTENLVLDLTPQINYTITDKKDKKLGDVCQWIPPLSECRKTPKVGAMIATVTDNKDPRGMGRLRIKYKWQNNNSARTPWIRMSTPFASKYGSGMFFYPQKDDEVLVDFYNGNIDRPIIVGALRNEKTERDYVTAYGVGGWAKRNDIAGITGQMLQFKDGYMAFNDLVKYWPGLGSILSAFNPSALSGLNWIQNAMQGGENKDVRDTDWQKYMRGSILMHDRYNTWEITGSTTDRKVSIASNLGTVSIDALSGITISAPLGDLTISAKNIKMQASNNILIESGTQIGRQRKIKENKRSGVEMFYDATKDAIKDKTTILKVDLSLLRLVIEAIIPPVEGTLQVKSNRYLKLEAGEKGSAEDSKNPFKMGQRSDAKKWLKSLCSPKSKVKDLGKAIEEYAEDFKKMKKAIDAIPGWVENFCKSRFEDRKKFLESYNAVKKYKFNTVNPVEFNTFDNTHFWDLENLKENEADNLSIDEVKAKIKNIINIDDDSRRNALFAYNAGNDLRKALKSVGLAYNKNKSVAAQQTVYGQANMRKFLKLAIQAARLANKFATENADTLKNKWAAKLAVAMGYANGKTTLQVYELVDNEVGTAFTISKDQMKEALAPLFAQLLEETEKFGDGAKTVIRIPSERYNEDTFVKSVVRAFLCKAINMTKCYVYDEGYAEATLNAVSTIGQLTPLVKIPTNQEITGMLNAASQDIVYFAGIRLGTTGSLEQRNNNWQYFTKTCKFITDFWANPPRTKGWQIAANTGGTLLEEASDLLGGTAILNDLAGIIGGSIIESACVKSATHGGRVLISDHGVTAGLNSNGTFEKTSAPSSRKWK